MVASEMFSLLPLLFVVLVQAALAVAMHFWGRWVARRHASAAWRLAAWMPLLALALSLLANAIAAVLIGGAFGSLADVDPSRKAAVLAAAISAAMSATAALTLTALALFVASPVAFTVGSLLRPRRGPPTP